jgi:hypothetical protein
MKVRTGFVSNSSSSSFIIAFNEKDLDERCPHCGRKDLNIFDIIERESQYDDDTGIKENFDIDQEIDYVTKECNPDYVQAQIDKLYALKKYDTIKAVRISYHNSTLNELIRQLQRNPKYTIISEDE